jgi:hypothetical protein
MWKYVSQKQEELKKEEAIFRQMQGDNVLRIEMGDKTVTIPPRDKK